MGDDPAMPIRVGQAQDVDWHDTADVVVVGFGGAGACAAIAAREHGAEVLAVDRFGGGGATALSGGVYYAGGTPCQQAAGVSDSAADMVNYLRLEVGDAVSDDTLQRFCDGSAESVRWLERQGMVFGSSLARDDEPYMAPGRTLYYSGNERVPRYARQARPAPRGHIAVGEGAGSKGVVFYDTLRHAALAAGVRFLPHCPVSRLVIDSMQRVVGIETLDLASDARRLRRHERYVRWFHAGKGILYGPPARWLDRALAAVEAGTAVRRIRARRAVILATGGFIQNRDMVRRHLPLHTHAIPLGSAGCRGDGILLGQSAGADVARMDIAELSRSLQIPSLFLHGLLVDRTGQRFVSEDTYGATIGHEILHHRARCAWLILDGRTWLEAWRRVLPWRPMILRYRLRALSPLLFATRLARSPEALAVRCGIDPAGLAGTIAAWNDAAKAGRPDPLGKLASHVRPLTGRFYAAIDCGTDSRGFPPLAFTLGGLRVDEQSGQVLGRHGDPVAGLFAAGRVCVGLPSNFYVSGLSLADCVFSGRRAGAYAAGQSTAGQFVPENDRPDPPG